MTEAQTMLELADYIEQNADSGGAILNKSESAMVVSILRATAAAQPVAWRDDKTLIGAIEAKGRDEVIKMCIGVKVVLPGGFGGKSDEYLTAFQAGCHAFIDALEKLRTATIPSDTQAMREALDKARAVLKGPHYQGGASLVAIGEAYGILDAALTATGHRAGGDK